MTMLASVKLHVNIANYVTAPRAQVSKNKLVQFFQLCDSDAITILEGAARGRLSEDEACVFGRQIASALAHCHSLGICHMDVKPDNVLRLNADFKLADFGACIIRSDGPAGGVVVLDVDDNALVRVARPRATMHASTPEYAPPEHFTNVAAMDVDMDTLAKADVWGLAMSLVGMATGFAPWKYARDSCERYRRWEALYCNKQDPSLATILTEGLTVELSPSCLDLLVTMLDPCVETRPSMADVLAHPWLSALVV